MRPYTFFGLSVTVVGIINFAENIVVYGKHGLKLTFAKSYPNAAFVRHFGDVGIIFKPVRILRVI